MALTPIKLTFEEYCQLPESVLPHELIDGELRMPAAPTLRHQDIKGNIFSPMRQHVRDRDLGRVWMAPLDVVLDQARPLVLQPDLALVLRERSNIARDKIYGAPDLVVEILSRSGAVFDRTEKATFYAHHGVREYWLVDPDAETVEVRRLELHGYETVGILRRGGTIHSLVLPDLLLSVDDVFTA